MLILAAVVVPPDWPRMRAGLWPRSAPRWCSRAEALAVWAGRALGRSLTPFPKPATAGSLVDNGPFRRVRHPIYSGGLLLFAGWSLFAGPVALVLTGTLGVLWALKARVEERHLAIRYPGYAAYARRVRFRLAPGLY